ncbi:hypothetical protein FJY63_10605 [Candidatus Sumerlaeota bacterium]|nr:hypothetical protein [Candidatus Sumerlaeota bacterium]
MAARQGPYKLVKIGGGTAQLFDLTADIGETRDLAREQPDRVEQLLKRLQDWNSQLIAPRWKGAPPTKYRPPFPPPTKPTNAGTQ